MLKYIKKGAVFFLSVFIALFFIYFYAKDNYKALRPSLNAQEEKEEQQALVKKSAKKYTKDTHIKAPDSVKAVYLSQCGAASLKIRKRIFELLDDTEINSVVIDIKDYTGTISFPTKLLGSKGKGCKVEDMKELIDKFHEKGGYVIGRITVFQDPLSKFHFH